MQQIISDCECNISGTEDRASDCTDEDGQCLCSSGNGYSGSKCDDCLTGWYWTSSDKMCTDCSCNTTGTTGASSFCTDEEGFCSCASSAGFTGSKCNECLEGWYWSGTERSCLGSAEIIVIGGLDTEGLGKQTESLSLKTDEACNVESFFEATSREGLNDGVFRGMVCDYIHGKAICCGGDFGANGNRVLLQKDCMSLEGLKWTNSTVDPLLEGLRYPSVTAYNDGTDDLWLLTGGEGNAQHCNQSFAYSYSKPRLNEGSANCNVHFGR